MDIGPIGQRDLLRRNHRRRNAFYYRGGLHPDTVDWLARVAAVGGSVSGSTIAAVDQFARSIDAAGIRSRFFRLNLFCGNNLTTALVPLYRGPSLSSQHGNAVDTNVNFVAADYAETGTAGGIQGKTGAYLGTGFLVSAVDPTSTHLAVYNKTATDGSNWRDIGADPGTPDSWQMMIRFSAGLGCYYRSTNNNLGIENYNIAAGVRTRLFIGTRTGASAAAIYRDGALLSTTPASFTGTPNATGVLEVFRGGGGSNTGRLLASYSAGTGLSASDVAAYSMAMQVFQTTLARAV